MTNNSASLKEMWQLRLENWSILSKKKSKNEIHLLWRCWEGQTTSLITFIFGMLVNFGKKAVCLQCRFNDSRDIDWLWRHIALLVRVVNWSLKVKQFYYYWVLGIVACWRGTQHKHCVYCHDSLKLSGMNRNKQPCFSLLITRKCLY